MQPRALTRLPARCAARAAVLAVLALTGSAAAVGAAPAHVGAARDVARLSTPPTPAECLAYTGGRCLTPAGLRSAYDLDGLAAAGTTGAGVTIGIVDSFGSPTITHDIAVYDRQYGLPAVDLQVITPEGPPPAYDAKNTDRVGWADESTLDVEVAHSVAPGAKIVLIETPTSETEGLAGFPQIIAAENYVISHHLVDVLSQSFAATEATFSSAAQVRQLSAEVYPAAEKAGVTVLSSSGDNGPTDDRVDETTLYTTPQTDWPASDPLVTSVGGTMLDIGADGSRAAADAAWGGQPGGGAGGGGRSTVFPRPAFQASVAGVVGDHRGVPDISLDAASSSGLITYGSFGGGDGWSVGGGTSQASPLLAGIVALADQKAHGRVGYLDPLLYGTLDNAADGIVDVARGSNDLVDAGGKPDPVPGYDATTGYDLATGLGTIDGGRFVPALAAAVAGHTQPLSAAAAGSPSLGPSPSPSGIATPSSGPVAHPVATAAHSSRRVPAIVGGVLLIVVFLAIVAAVLRGRRR